MKTHVEKSQKGNIQAESNFTQQQSISERAFRFIDNRPEGLAFTKLQATSRNSLHAKRSNTYQEIANNSPQVRQLRAFQDRVNASPQAQKAAQLQAMANHRMAGGTVQSIDNKPDLSGNVQTGIEKRVSSSMDDIYATRPANYKHIVQLKAYPQKMKGIKSGRIVQRTKWKHDGTKWNMLSTTSTDKDSHPLPAAGSYFRDDQFDQETGVYTSPLKDALTTLGKSSGSMGFYDKRSATGYKYASGKNQQGPHTLGHITKRVGMAAGVQAGRDPLNLRGSRAFPRPRRMNKMLRERLAVRGPNWKKETRSMRTLYLRTYKKNWINSKKKTNMSQRLNAIRAGIELNPATVYNIGKGTTTGAEISGKGENRAKGAADWIQLLKTTGAITDTSGLHTLDVSGATSIEKDEALRMAGATRDWLRTGQTDEDSGDSESDSEMEDLDKI